MKMVVGFLSLILLSSCQTQGYKTSAENLGAESNREMASNRTCRGHDSLLSSEVRGTHVFASSSSVDKFSDWGSGRQVLVYFDNLTINDTRYGCKVIAMVKEDFKGIYENTYSTMQREFMRAVTSRASISFTLFLKGGRQDFRIGTKEGSDFTYSVKRR